jgi:hypothetical protein
MRRRFAQKKALAKSTSKPNPPPRLSTLPYSLRRFHLSPFRSAAPLRPNEKQQPELCGGQHGETRRLGHLD